MVVFVSSPVPHCSMLIKLGPALNVRRLQLCTSFLVLLMAEATGFLCLTYTQLFLLPAMVTIIIAATRTYRTLTLYASAPQSSAYDILPFSMLTVRSLFSKLS